MYGRGWDEHNGGNVSLLLEESHIKDYVDGTVLHEIPTGFFCPELYVRPLIGKIRSRAYAGAVDDRLFIGVASLGSDAPVIGAAFLDRAE